MGPVEDGLVFASRLYRERTLMFSHLTSRDPEMLDRLNRAHLAATRHDLPILITGETGTGKNLLALAIHNASPRRGGPFVPLNLGGISGSLAESELFGHEKGAFTGAVSARGGLLEMAEGGTLFIDEIGNLSPETQQTLLTAIERKTFFRVGGRKEIHVDFRLICATNADLQQAIQAGSFRSDLYHRLSNVPIRLPPLRNRPNDLNILSDRFLAEANVLYGREAKGFEAGGKERLLSYPWPGNLRELRSRISSAVAMSPNPMIGETDLFPDIEAPKPGPPQATGCNAPPPAEDEDLSLAAAEKRHIVRILNMCGEIISHTALRLKIKRQTLYAKLKYHGIDPKKC